MKTLAKVYFWFLIVIDVLGYAINFLYYHLNAGALILISIDIVLSVFILYAFYCIAFATELKYRSILKVFLPFFFVWEIAIFYLFQVHIQGAISSLPLILIAWLVYLPEYIAVAVRTYRSLNVHPDPVASA